MFNFLHDFRAWLWGVVTRHPCVRDTKIGWVFPLSIQLENSAFDGCIKIYYCRPQLHILNAYELEADFLKRGQLSHE